MVIVYLWVSSPRIFYLQLCQVPDNWFDQIKTAVISNLFCIFSFIFVFLFNFQCV